MLCRSLLKKDVPLQIAGEKEVAKKPPAWIEKLNKFLSQVQQMDRQEDVFEDPEPVMGRNLFRNN